MITQTFLTVSQLNRRIRQLLEGNIGEVWVEGEISNLRKQASGHQYFTLKDESGQLACVLFRGSAIRNTNLSDGQQVQVFGRISVYEARGQYQLVVQLIQSKGVGILQARFEALKQKLQAEGLFDSAKKRPVPSFPERVGVVTSPTGAAIRDFLNILGRRAPWIEVIIFPVRVQGEEAAHEIANAIAAFPLLAEPPDVIVVTRGGGSLEDLWAFNEEVVARAIAECPIPIVSAVGHEIDFTISDFAADLRVPTPSAAAEQISPDAATLAQRVVTQSRQMERQLREVCSTYRNRLRICESSVLLREPPRRLEEARMQVDDIQERLLSCVQEQLRQAFLKLEAHCSVLREQRPDHRVTFLQERLKHLLATIQSRTLYHLQSHQSRTREVFGKLQLLGPQATLKRGYTMTLDSNGKLIRLAEMTKKGQALRTVFPDGEVVSRIEK